jgi:threonine/homoserine/homoserine lactone efflux protein
VIEPAALLAWSALALAVTLTPGPDTLLVVSHSARSGFRVGMAALAGIMGSVVLWYGSLIAFGALSVLVAVPALFTAVKIAGALYLAWIGAGMLWSAVRGEPSPPLRGRGQGEGGRANMQAPERSHAPHPPTPSPQGRGGARAQAFRQGFLTNALNPKVALFYLAALPQFTGASASAPLIGVMLLAIHAVLGVVWLSFIAYGAATARRLTWNRNFVRWLEGAIGAFFVGAAARLALAQR